jgi:hypothetical protein
MTEHGPVTRLGSADEAGGRPASGGSYVRYWQWGSDEARRPGLPWIGIFLVVFGGLLLLEQALPAYRQLGDVVILAAGVASLVAWAINRSTLMLYAGAFLTALALPGTIEALGVALGPGWGTLFFGAAFGFIALVRWSRAGGVGWQAWYGAILALIGGAQVIRSDVAGLAFPIIVVLVGLALLLRGAR